MRFKEVLIIQTTLETSKDALELAQKCLKKEFVACCQIQQVRSLFKWKGKLEEGEEYQLTLKTLPEKKEILQEFFKKEHPYECPDLTFFIKETTNQYVSWMEEVTRKKKNVTTKS